MTTYTSASDYFGNQANPPCPWCRKRMKETSCNWETGEATFTCTHCGGTTVLCFIPPAPADDTEVFVSYRSQQ